MQMTHCAAILPLKTSALKPHSLMFLLFMYSFVLALLLSEAFQLSTFSSIISQANRKNGHRHCLGGPRYRRENR